MIRNGYAHKRRMRLRRTKDGGLYNPVIKGAKDEQNHFHIKSSARYRP